MDIEGGLSMYLRHHRAEGSSPRTLEWHASSIRRFAQFLEASKRSPEVERVTADDLRAYIASEQDLGHSPHSIRTWVRSIKAFGRWLTVEEVIGKDPFARIRQPKAPDSHKGAIEAVEVERLLSQCDPATTIGRRDSAMMVLLFSTGLRAKELVGLRKGDIDWRAGCITVRDAKGGRLRVVPLGKTAARFLLRHIRGSDHPPDADEGVFLGRGGKRLTTDGLATILRRRGEALGIHCNPHLWRHTAAITYLRAGGRIDALQAMLGHRTLEMTTHYARLAAPDLVEQHAIADPAKLLKAR